MSKQAKSVIAHLGNNWASCYRMRAGSEHNYHLYVLLHCSLNKISMMLSVFDLYDLCWHKSAFR